jgi:Holliday junction resolvase RusA-like endonuclease
MLEVHVQGTPVPQGSKRCFCRGGRATLVEANKALRPWRDAVTLTARAAMAQQGWPTSDEPLTLSAVFTTVRPASSKREQPAVKPDLDKLLRALLDGFTDAGVWTDDSRVVAVQASKHYGAQPGVYAVVKAAQHA